MKKELLAIIGYILLFTNFAVAQNYNTGNSIDSLQNLAIYQRNQGDYQHAISYINKAISEIDKSNYDKYAELLSNLALFYIESDNVLKAIEYQAVVIKIREDNLRNDEDKTKLAISLYNMINYCDVANDSINSLIYNHKLIDNNYPLDMFEYIYLNIYNLSSVYYEKNDITKAIFYANKAIKHCFEYKNTDEHRDNYIYLICYLRDIYVEIGNYEQAIDFQKKYIETFSSKNSDYATAIALLAEYYTKQKENETNILLALELLIEASNIRAELEGIKSDSFIRTQLNIANHLITLGHFNESIECLEPYLKNLNPNSDRYVLGIKFMAAAYARLKNYNKAIDLLLQIQNNAIERNDSITYYESIIDIADYEQDVKNYNTLLEKCQYVIRKIQKNKTTDNRLSELYNHGIKVIGYLFFKMGNYKQATIFLENSIKNIELKQGKNNFDYLGIGSHLTNCYIKTNINKADSLSYLLTDIAYKMSYDDYIVHLNNRSVVLSKLGRHKEAIKCLEEVRSSFKIKYGDNNPIYATACHNIGVDYSSLGDELSALKYFNEALKIRMIHESDNPVEYLESLYSIITSKMNLKIDCINDTENYLSKCIGLLSDIKFLTSEQRLLYHKAFNKNALDYITFNNVKNTELLYNYILFSKELLLELDKNKDINTQIYTWDKIKQNLKDNEIAIEFINYPKDKEATIWQFEAFIIKGNYETPKRIRLFEIDNNDKIGITIEKGFNVWSKLTSRFSEKDNVYFTPTDILYNYNPIKNNGRCENRIPIESLPIGDGKIMSDVYNMHRLSSTRELVKKKKEVKYTKAALYGGLNYDMTDDELLSASQTYTKEATTEYFVSRGLLEDSIRGYKWDNLSNTQKEVDYISDLMKKNQITTQIYKGNKGNEESFKALSGHEYNIIHLATHGFFYPDEEAKEKDYFKSMLLNDHYQKFNEVDMSMWRSGLVMSGGNRAWKGDTIPDTVEDGILKAQEIGDLDLRGADLVVLSACNTGQGEVTGEGVFGLQRAFKMAGAQTIVMSLTPVDDQTTMAMMNKFYTNLFSGQSKHDAFYNAQRYIRSIKPDPKYWMGWIMLD